jgi:hypothetical protein
VGRLSGKDEHHMIETAPESNYFEALETRISLQDSLSRSIMRWVGQTARDKSRLQGDTTPECLSKLY